MIEPRPLRLCEGRLAALSWGEVSSPTWLALHGWLDNAASFSRLAPLLVERLGIRVVAIDFSGHGLSQPRAGDGDYALWDYCHDLLDACDSLGMESTTILAHSMGTGVACLTASALPERVARLVLIDGLGALTTDFGDVPRQLRKGLLAHRRPVSSSPRYPDVRTAVAARVTGGATRIDAETAQPLVKRNLMVLPEGRVQLRTDGRLLRPSLLRLSPEQLLAVLAAIRCPLLLVEGDTGILAGREAAERLRSAVSELERRVLKGGHHLHLESGSVAAVADTILAWHRELVH